MSSKLLGSGLGARLVRSAGWTVFGTIGSQVLRFASNLVLTRLLYPEAFGLMALVTVFIVSLTLISDVGVGVSIQRHPRGADPDFLNTAWTMHVVRGAILATTCIGLGFIAAYLYGEKRLELMLPVAGISLLISGLTPTRVDTAARDLAVGRLTFLDMFCQLLTLAVTLSLAVAIRSVWALVLGTVAGAAIRLAVMYIFMPGQPNRWHWDSDASRDLFGFGKWIFLTTICTLLLTQADKAILGYYLSLDMLGVYNIGISIGGVGIAIAGGVVGRVLIPMYRERPPKGEAGNLRRVRQARFVLTSAVLFMQFGIAFSAVWLVHVLYDARFWAAGSVAVALACTAVPYIVVIPYDASALAAGDSRSVFYYQLCKAIAQTILFVGGLELGGLPWALAGVWMSQIVVYPQLVAIAKRHGSWDWTGDAIFAAVGLILTLCVLWVNREALQMLWTIGLES